MVMRIGGLASGMDIDELVKKLMSAEKAPLNKLYQKKTTYEWQRDAYRGVNTKLKTFDTYIADNLILKSLNTKTATSSNSNLVSATATGKATGTLSIEGVSQLATAARGVGTQINAEGSTKVSDLFAGGTMPKSIELKSITSAGTLANTATKIDLDANITVDQFVSKINSSNAGVSAIFESGKLSITAKNTGDNKTGAEVVVTSGQKVFEKFGFSDSTNIAKGGSNAVFQVNGIATERSSNSFTINGYNVTLKDEFNGTQTIANKYTAAQTELANAQTNKTTKSDALQIAKDDYYGTGATSTPNYTAAHDSAYTSAFGNTLSLSQQENYAKIGKSDWKNFSANEISIFDSLTANSSVTDIKTAIGNSTLSEERKSKLTAFSDEKLQTLSSLNATEMTNYKIQANYETYGTKLKDFDSDARTAITNFSFNSTDELSVIHGNIDNNTAFSNEVKDVLKSLSKEDLTNLLATDTSTLTTYQAKAQADDLKAKYNTLGESFLTGAIDHADLTDAQRDVLNGLDSTKLSQFQSLANQNKLRTAYKNAEAEDKAADVRLTNGQNTFNTAKADALEAKILDNTNNIDTTAVDSVPTTPAVTMTSTTNVDDMMTKIKEFVNTYNGLVKDLTDQTKQSKYRDYVPLTDEQKEDMSENEIKLWEEKAKSGLLRSDSIIRNGLSNMRSLIYQSNPAVENSKFNTLYNIGITTSKNYNDGGTLEIDEAKLRKALEEDPDSVVKLLSFSDGKEKDSIQVEKNGQMVTKEFDSRGFFQKLRGSMKAFEIDIEKKAGRSTMTDTQYTIGKNLVDAGKRIDTWKSKLDNIEARYWKQFTAMESAINKANQQSSIFATGQ